MVKRAQEEAAVIRWSLTIDCAHRARLTEFSALALSYLPTPGPAGFASWEEVGLGVGLVEVVVDMVLTSARFERMFESCTMTP
jgi:hypothetical protein